MSIPKKFLLSLCSLLLFSQTAWAQEIIPIERAVEIALLNNPEFRISRSEVDISKSLLTQAKAPLYPQLKGKVVVPFVGRESGFYVDQMIWDFGKTRARVRAREHHLESAEHSLTGSKTMLVRDTHIAYYQALSEKNRLQEAATETQRREWLLEKTEELFAVGKRSAQQLSQAGIDLQQAKLELVSRENSYELAMLNLRHLMNDPSLEQFDIRENLFYEKVNETRENLVGLAFSQNPDIKSLLADRGGIKASLAENRGKFLPSIFGRAAYRFEGEGAETPAFIAGVGIRIPIFEGFSRFGQMAQSRAELVRNDAQTELLRNRIILSVGELYLQLKHLEKRIGIFADSESISEKNLRLVKERYEARSASKIELAEAQALYEEAVADYKNSIYDYKIVRLRLLSLCGKEIP
ncbi:MAG: TolC family protein [Candidatus Dadabacteria bacterium]|nr:TolC family protein [Candidatus Dadabacteria bacterium]MYA48074.1 TolC family protein [Candidatus Dadabacteria bacterium]MYG83468.1 TolC family protein [Candidatus Dadabacteria bacterium]MYK49586.1 TolC family protein [Candidatus Dadabacteria bacterium]